MKSAFDWIKIGLLIGIGIGLGLLALQFLWPFVFLLGLFLGGLLALVSVMAYFGRLAGTLNGELRLLHGWWQRNRR